MSDLITVKGYNKYVKWIIVFLLSILVILAMYDFIMSNNKFEDTSILYSLYGSSACILIVLFSKVVGLICKKKENYYD